MSRRRLWLAGARSDCWGTRSDCWEPRSARFWERSNGCHLASPDSARFCVPTGSNRVGSYAEARKNGLPQNPLAKAYAETRIPDVRRESGRPGPTGTSHVPSQPHVHTARRSRHVVEAEPRRSGLPQHAECSIGQRRIAFDVAARQPICLSLPTNLRYSSFTASGVAALATAARTWLLAPTLNFPCGAVCRRTLPPT